MKKFTLVAYFPCLAMQRIVFYTAHMELYYHDT